MNINLIEPKLNEGAFSDQQSAVNPSKGLKLIADS